MLATLQATAQQLDETNKILTKEASTVLEALWNGQQELTVLVTDVIRRLGVAEEALGIDPPEEEHEETQPEKETEGQGGLQESKDGPGEDSLYRYKEVSESSEVPSEESPDGGDAESDDVPGEGPNA